MKYSLISLALALGASAAPGFQPSFTPSRRAAGFALQNGQDAIALKYVVDLSASSPQRS